MCAQAEKRYCQPRDMKSVPDQDAPAIEGEDGSATTNDGSIGVVPHSHG